MESCLRSEDSRGQMGEEGGGNSPYGDQREDSRHRELLTVMTRAMEEILWNLFRHLGPFTAILPGLSTGPGT